MENVGKRTPYERGGGGGGAVSEIFGQNAQNSGNKETIKDGIKKYINKAKI